MCVQTLFRKWRSCEMMMISEVDSVVGFGVPVTLGAKPAPGSGKAAGKSAAKKKSAIELEAERPIPSLDLLNLSRPKSSVSSSRTKSTR